MAAKRKTRSGPGKSDTAPVVPVTKSVEIKIGSKSFKLKAAIITLPAGAYAERVGPVGAHVVIPLDKGTTRITRTTTGAGKRRKVEKISVASGQAYWVPPTPKGVTVRIDNSGGGAVTMGKLYGQPDWRAG